MIDQAKLLTDLERAEAEVSRISEVERLRAERDAMKGIMRAIFAPYDERSPDLREAVERYLVLSRQEGGEG